MTHDEIAAFIREERVRQGISGNKLATLSGLSYYAVKCFLDSKCNTSLYTATKLLAGLGYGINFVRLERTSTPVPDTSQRKYGPRIMRPENEFACLKCGRDAGVAEVAGHVQCAHCGHIIQDCCGD